MDEPNDQEPERKKPRKPKKLRAKNGKGKKGEKPTLPDALTVLQHYTGDIVEPEHETVMGRPTKYTPEAGSRLMAVMRDGYSVAAAAAAIGVCRDTIYEWSKKHPDFSYALKRGHDLRVFRLETQLLRAIDGAQVTSAIFALKNAAPDIWRDKHEIATTTTEDDPLLIFLRSLNGTAIRPREQLPAPNVIDGEAVEIIQRPAEAPPPRPIQGGSPR